MSRLARLSTALKALRQLGFTPLALNALYKFGLASGHYRRAIRPPVSASNLQLRPLFPLPAREQLLEILGKTGLQTLLAEADEIVSGKFRQFGDDLVEINLTPPTPLAHWTEYETGHVVVGATGQSPQDIKFIWEPARFGWAFILGRAYHLCGDEKYARAFWRYFKNIPNRKPALPGAKLDVGTGGRAPFNGICVGRAGFR